MSAAHGAGVTFVVVAADGTPVGCDVEPAAERPAADWAGLLGPTQFALASLLSAEHDEDLSLAATRVWTAMECLRKMGQARTEPVMAAAPRADRWVLLRCGGTRIATFTTSLQDWDGQVVFAMSIEGDE